MGRFRSKLEDTPPPLDDEKTRLDDLDRELVRQDLDREETEPPPETEPEPEPEPPSEGDKARELRRRYGH